MKSDRIWNQSSSNMRVLLVQRAISHYRRGFYEALGKEVDLTVLHTRPTSDRSSTFCEMFTSQVDFGPVQWQRRVLGRIHRYDVAVFPFNVRSITAVAAPLLSRSVPIVYWGLGDGASPIANRVRRLLLRRASALILYSERARRAYLARGVPASMLFVAPNSMLVPDTVFNGDPNRRTSFLVIGTLDARKRIDKVVRAFAEAQPELPDNILLEVVGDGPELSSLTQLAERLGIAPRVRFHGRMTRGPGLSAVFARALAAVSPNQAGLSVMHTAANGIPFITRSDAITGGEIEFIVDGETGFLYTEDQDLARIMVQLANDRRRSVTVGQQARDHYHTRHSVRQMVDGFKAALEYAAARGP
jgi:glycosyltransferase involved in cell wall biosynthesis